ncbi:MAG: DNA alkylation repair protein [Aquamicrobium sp.]|uniref:DNA alkylation repair protein n=1 Tax=Aquamicrobium sp. TaxID=1872579 RepID=UPI00349EF2C2|nr:DNA alkylation repair protein [Aquamicrobium sp.]
MAAAAGLSSASTAAEIAAHMETLRSETNVAGMARYGIRTDTALGISNPDMRKIARLVGRDHARAMGLWRTGIREARMLALYTAEPGHLTADEARRWAADFASWEIVDAAADLFVEARLEAVLVPEFAADEREFVRRAAFAMIAGAAVHLKREPDAALLAWLPLIERHAGDGRNFVKKAVNWALRNIGKRSMACHAPALALAERLAACDDRTARWIGKDAARELSDEKTLARVRQKT